MSSSSWSRSTPRHPENRSPGRQGAPIPPDELETVRRRILACLEGGALTTKELSSAVGRREKEIGEHLEHLRKSLRAAGRRLVQIPAVCRDCGFVFRKRGRIRGPGHCPLCRGESIADPAFRVEGG